MNTYTKYCPNVFCAKCEEPHEKGETITMTTKHGGEHDAIVFNLLFEREGFYYYSVIRADGMNSQQWAQKRADRLNGFAANAEKKSNQYYLASQEAREFLSLGEPIKVGHHSEKRHRALIDRNWNRMGKSVEFNKKAEEYEGRAEYWERKAKDINLSMPESLEFYEYELEKAKAKHAALKSGETERSHSYSLTYAKKEVNEIQQKLKIANKLWA